MAPILRLTLLFSLTSSALAQDATVTVKMAAIKGSVRARTESGADTPAKEGLSVRPGTTIATGAGSAIDLFLGNEAGTLRLTEKAKLVITQFTVSPIGTVEEIQLHLVEGTLLGMGNQLPVANRYQIKISNGVVDVQAKGFRVSAQGFLVAMEGKLAFAHIGPAPDFSVQLHELISPPPSYFWPGQAVSPAPDPLVREVAAQSNARLR